MTVRVPLRDAVSVAWALLIAATLVSWTVGEDHGNGHTARQVATVVVLLVAFVKARLVGMYFMELRHAPIPLRVLFETWCLVVGGGIIVLYMVM